MGRNKKPPRKVYPVKIDEATLQKAKKKHPDLHRQVVGFITSLADTDL